MNSNKKRGQAALEFLTTYGWAFLVILIMIGALAYFGVLNPKSILPSRCTFSPEIDCIEANINGDPVAGGNVSFRFRNSVGSSASFAVSMVYIGGNNPSANTCVEAGGELLDNVPPGRTREISCEFTEGVFPVEDKAKFEVTINVTKSGGSYTNPVKGEIYGTVNPE